MTAILLPLSPRDGETPALAFLQHVFGQPGAERVHGSKGVRAAAQTPAAGGRLGELTQGAVPLPDSTAENAGPLPQRRRRQRRATAQSQSALARRLAGPLPATSGKMVAGAARRPSFSGSLWVGGCALASLYVALLGKCPLIAAFLGSRTGGGGAGVFISKARGVGTVTMCTDEVGMEL